MRLGEGDGGETKVGKFVKALACLFTVPQLCFELGDHAVVVQPGVLATDVIVVRLLPTELSNDVSERVGVVRAEEGIVDNRSGLWDDGVGATSSDRGGRGGGRSRDLGEESGVRRLEGECSGHSERLSVVCDSWEGWGKLLGGGRCDVLEGYRGDGDAVICLELHVSFLTG
jgi:hypothetical protein